MADLRARRKNEHKSGNEALLRMDMAGVLELVGKKYAVNLLWLTFDEAATTGETVKAQKRIRNDLIKPDFLGERFNLITQQAYGHLKKGHKLGMPVGAAILTDILVGEWHGCFKAENGWWYVAVHGDAIAPDGDLFFDSEEKAYAHFTAANERQNWPRAYAPSEWSVEGSSEELDLKSLFANALPSTHLKPVTITALFGNVRNTVTFFIALSFLVLVMLAFGTTSLSSYFSPPPEVKRNVTLDITDPIIVPPRYVDSSIEANRLLEIDDFPAPILIETCLRTFEDMFVPLPGWQIDNLSCRDGNVIATWDRTKARIADLNKLRSRFSSDVVMTYDGKNKLLVRKPLDLSSIERVSMQVQRKEILYAAITGRLESKGDLSISQVESPAPPQQIDPNTGEIIPAPPPDKFLSIEFQSPISAYEWLDDFDIQGMRPLELIWSVKDSQWRLSGLVQYQ